MTSLTYSTRSICSDVKRAFRECNEWQCRQENVKEESLTDWLLDRISLLRKEVRYRCFTRHEEARESGADWEWWLLYRDGAVRLRVQAKKLVRNRNAYAELARTNKHGMQYDYLIEGCSKVNAIPMYMFYSSRTSMCPHRRQSFSGAHVMLATDVGARYLDAKTVVKPSDVVRNCWPASCLCCCTAGMSWKSAMKVIRSIHNMGEINLFDTPSLREAQGYFSKAPDFVFKLLEQTQDRNPSDRPRSVPRNVDRFLIADFR